MQPFEHISQEIHGVIEKEDIFDHTSRQKEIPKILQIPHKSIQTGDTIAFETSTDLKPTENISFVANESFIMNNVVEVTENKMEDSIYPYDTKLKTPYIAQKNILCESHVLEISDIPINERELPITGISIKSPKSAIVKLSTLEHLSTIETNAGESTTKFYPEMIVATEVANTNINSLYECNTEIIDVVEPQDELNVPKISYHNANSSMNHQEMHTATAQSTIVKGKCNIIKIFSKNKHINIYLTCRQYIHTTNTQKHRNPSRKSTR